MARTKAAETKGRETIAKRRENDGKASGQMRMIIVGILGEKGKDKMYEEREAGTRKKGKETKGEGNTGRDEGDKGHKEEERGETEKDGGAHPDQDTRGSNSHYPYPLVKPGRGEDLDNSSGSDTHHGRFASDDAQHDRHTTDHTKAKTGDSKGGQRTARRPVARRGLRGS